MKEKKPRYSRISDLLDLAIFMSSKVQGITLSDIIERYNISRRTAERMRDGLMCIFPQIDEIATNDKKKHWGFINYSLAHLIVFTPKEIVNIEQLQRRTTNKELKKELQVTIDKIKSFNKKDVLTLENKVELFMQTEGYAVRQMPQYEIGLENLDIMRTALQNSKMVSGIYHNKKRLIEPLGMIYGDKIYLIAKEKLKGDGIYNYLLHKFEKLELTDKSFSKGDFNLQQYANQSFGVYHGKILDVKLEFCAKIADEAAKFNFHPTQKFTKNKDGSLIVEFKASGDKEIIWHVFKWGKDCKILKPKSLNNEYKKYLQEVLEQQ